MGASSAGDDQARRLRRRIEELIAVCGRLRAQLEALETRLTQSHERLRAGVPAVGEPALLAAATESARATATVREYEHALRMVRSAVVGVLVDQQGLSFSAAAQQLGVSRTVVSRLHDELRKPDQGPGD